MLSGLCDTVLSSTSFISRWGSIAAGHACLILYILYIIIFCNFSLTFVLLRRVTRLRSYIFSLFVCFKSFFNVNSDCVLCVVSGVLLWKSTRCSMHCRGFCQELGAHSWLGWASACLVEAQTFRTAIKVSGSRFIDVSCRIWCPDKQPHNIIQPAFKVGSIHSGR